MENNTINYDDDYTITSGAMVSQTGATFDGITSKVIKLKKTSAKVIVENVIKNYKSISFPNQKSLAISPSKNDSEDILQNQETSLIDVGNFSVVKYDNAGLKLVVSPEKKDIIVSRQIKLFHTQNIDLIKGKEAIINPVSNLDNVTDNETMSQLVQPKLNDNQNDTKIEMPTDENTTELINGIFNTVANINGQMEFCYVMSDKNKEAADKIATLQTDIDILHKKSEEHQKAIDSHRNLMIDIRECVNELEIAIKIKAEEARKKAELNELKQKNAENELIIATNTEKKLGETRRQLESQTKEAHNNVQLISKELNIDMPTSNNINIEEEPERTFKRAA